MSAFRYLIFVAGVVLAALFGAVLNQFANPLLTQTSESASSAYAATGVGWMQDIWALMPVIVLALLVFGLLVGTIVRRNVPGVR